MVQYKKYVAVTPEIIEKSGGNLIARDGEVVTLEGPEETRRVVLLEFPSVERAMEFYNSEEYQVAKRLREGAAEASFIVVAGV